MKKISFIFLCFLIISCIDKGGVIYKKKIVLDNLDSKENCFSFFDKNKDTIAFSRKVEIIENTVKDTLVFGYGILPPMKTGTFQYLRYKDKLLDLSYKNPPTKELCISFYNNNSGEGYLIVKLKELNHVRNP